MGTKLSQQVKYQRDKLAQGLCPLCGRELANGRKRCALCLRKDRNRHKNKRVAATPATGNSSQ